MGLDMYLTKDVYIGEKYKDVNNVEVDYTITKDGVELKLDNIESIKSEVMYWRKANYIHNWFVQNVQDGVDDCERYYVSPEKLKEFYDVLIKTNLEKNPEYLPPVEGFFFGSSEVDDWYWDDILRTLTVLRPIINELKKPPEDRDTWLNDEMYYYQSSW